MIVRQTEGGQTWAELARLDPLASVLDPADSRGRKNRLIDRVHKRALAHVLGDFRGRRVLDFGCGTGRLSSWLVHHGADVDGVDVTPEMVAVARVTARGARVQTIDGRVLPFADDQFDAVVTAYVLQYYLDDDGTLACELERVLRPGGSLVAIEQVTDGEIGRGGVAAAYERMLAAGGLGVRAVTPIRMSDSRVLILAERLPGLAALPVTASLVMREAAARAGKPLTDGRYADAVFWATKADV